MGSRAPKNLDISVYRIYADTVHCEKLFMKTHERYKEGDIE